MVHEGGGVKKVQKTVNMVYGRPLSISSQNDVHSFRELFHELFKALNYNPQLDSPSILVRPSVRQNGKKARMNFWVELT